MTGGWLRPHAGLWSLLLAVAVTVGACTAAGSERGLTVFAAASLRTVVAQLEAAWLEEHPDAPLTVSSEASNVLAAQIREGAPADVFLSADTLRPQQLAADDQTAGRPVTFAWNRLTLVVPDDDGHITSPADLAEPGVRIVGVSEGAPVARYTRQAIEALAAVQPEAGAFTAAVEANIVSREDNVRAALAKVELGEGDAAFVYVTDALVAEGVREVPLPELADVRAEYAAVQVSARPLAAEFLRWLGEPEALAIIEAAGFETNQ